MKIDVRCAVVGSDELGEGVMCARLSALWR